MRVPGQRGADDLLLKVSLAELTVLRRLAHIFIGVAERSVFEREVVIVDLVGIIETLLWLKADSLIVDLLAYLPRKLPRVSLDHRVGH